ncbi:MAG: hypothetical protein HS118_01075 [Bacteroidia bacterium]|nr:hypothetical protein [Bacteroidia bacterium]
MNIYSYQLKTFLTKLGFVLALLLLWTPTLHAQTVLLDPTTDGGFENSTSTFAANGWTEVQDNDNRRFRVGTPAGSVSPGTKAAYEGTASNYNGSNASGTDHFYRDVAVPSGATNVQLSFYLRMPTNDNGNDYIRVFTTTTSNTPVTDVVPGSGYTKVFENTATTYSSFTQMSTIDLTSWAGSTVRLVFSFTSNGTNPHANPAIDNVSITYTPSSPCSGTPAPGNTTTTGANPICANTSFTLGFDGSVSGSGLTYQWQSSPDNVSWSNISGATSATYTTSLTASTWYRCNVTCSGNTGTSTPLQVTKDNVGNCVCTGAFGYSCNSDYISNVTFATINRSSTCDGSLPTNRTFYSTPNPVVYRGLTYTLSVTTDGDDEAFRAWIDYDQDGTFSNTESVLAAPVSAPGTTTSAQITIPLTASTGECVLRIRNRYNTGVGAGGACVNWNSDFGETEDYLITIMDAPACSGAVSGGTTQFSPSGACSGEAFTASLNGATIGTGITYQWQSSSDNITYTDISGATSSSYNGTASASDWYRCIVTCTNSSSTDTSVAAQLTINPFYLCNYCSVTSNCNLDDIITNVTLSTLNNTSSCSSGGYGDYRTGLPIPQLSAGGSYPMSVTVGPGGTEHVAVWIDYDHSGTFDASEYTYLGSGNGTTINGTLNIPGSPPQTGITAMRVRDRYNTTLTSGQACTTYSYGETEDYLVNIGNATCLNAPVSPSNGGSGCPVNGTVNLIWNTLTGATGYDVYFDVNNPPTTLVSANQSDTTYNATVVSGTYYWMIVPQIGGGGSSCNVWSFTISPAPTAVASSGGDVCEGTDIDLYSANTAPGQGSGNSFAWSGPNGFTSTIQNTNVTNPNSSNSGYYVVIVTNQYGCTAADSVNVTVNPNPTLNIISTQNVGCMGGSDGTATIGATGGTPDYDFTADYMNYYQGTSQATVPDLSEGTTTIYVSDANGCSSTIDVTLTYDYAAPPSQPDPITGAPTSVCPNPTDGPYTLSTSATDAATYHWYPGINITGVNFLSPDGSSSIDVEFGTTVNSTYVIRVEASNACGTSAYRAVMIRRTVSTPASITGNNITCANTNNVAYSCAAVTGADSYEWTITGDATVTGTTENVTVNFGPAWTGGTLCVAAKVGCFTSSTKCMTISSSVSAAAIGAITGTFTACPNAVQTYSVANISGATYNWTTPSNSNITQGAGTNSVEVTFQNNYNNIGNICVTVVSSCGVSTGPKCKTINPTVPKRPVSITGPASGLCNGNVNYSVPPQAGMNFQWTTPGTIIGLIILKTINAVRSLHYRTSMRIGLQCMWHQPITLYDSKRSTNSSSIHHTRIGMCQPECNLHGRYYQHTGRLYADMDVSEYSNVCKRRRQHK